MTCSRPYNYVVHYVPSTPGSGPTGFGQSLTFRGLVEILRDEHWPEVERLEVFAHIESWPLPVSVPRELYACLRDGQWVIRESASVPEHWEMPIPYSYYAVDFQRSIWAQAPTLQGVARELRRAGHHFVSSNDLKISACFARRDGWGDDTVEVPAFALCHDEECVLGREESKKHQVPDDLVGVEHMTLLDEQHVPPHFLFASYLLEYRRVQGLLGAQSVHWTLSGE